MSDATILDQVLLKLKTGTVALSEADALIRQYQGGVVDPQTPFLVKMGMVPQSVIDSAPDGSTVLFEPGIHQGPITLGGSKKLTLRAQVELGSTGRTVRGGPTASIIAGDTQTVSVVGGKGTIISQLRLRTSNGDSSVVDLSGATGVVLDRCEVVGDTLTGAHRGVIANGINIQIIKSFIDDCFGFGRDCMAVGCWDGCKDLIISDSYLGGGAMSFMSGGGDSLTFDRLPTNITIDSCTLSKNKAWFTNHVQIKNAFELKAAVNVKLTNSILEYAGTSAGQGGFLIVLTPRNQDGSAPWSQVQNVLIENNIGRYAGGVAQFLGRDDGNVSGILGNIVINNNKFTDIDPKGLTGGRGRMFEFSNRPDTLTLSNLTVEAKNFGARGYFMGPVDRLTLKNILIPRALYDWKIDSQGQGLDAVRVLCPDVVLEQLDRLTGLPPTGADLTKLPTFA